MNQGSTRSILITGATGFIGKALLNRLRNESSYIVKTAGRHANADINIHSLDETTQWDGYLNGIDIVIHLAAHVHVMTPQKEDVRSFHRVNVLGTKNLAEAAARSGVSRFIFLSTVKVHGEYTISDPWTEESSIAPQDAYAISKAEAERVLHDVSDATAMEIVIIRPPLVYGPMVKANFQTLLKAVYSGMPLPFYGVQNRRSMIYLGNLVDALVLCLWHEHAANQTFLVSDDNDVSISELIINIAQQMRKKPRLFHFPLSLLKTIALVMGKKRRLIVCHCRYRLTVL